MTDMLERIFNLIWREEKIPQNWSRMMVKPIHKQCYKLNPENYRALLSITGKVFCRNLLKRMKDLTGKATKQSFVDQQETL